MIRVFNPNNGEYLCEIIDIDKDKKRRKSTSLLRILIKEQLKLPVLSPSLVSVPLLYMAPIKKQRMKILLEKVTELGIDDIIPVVTQNTEKGSIVNSNNNDDNGNGQYDRILIESSEQCERLSIPTLHQTLELEDLLKSSDNNNNILLVCRERYQGGIPLLSFLNQLSSSSSQSSLKAIGLLVGPEGGFTQEEFEKMSKCKSVKFISLGDNVLRAETAAINAISVINAYYLSK
jgi:16S rRNA (uracil1498-N3)-methyltransferase